MIQEEKKSMKYRSSRPLGVIRMVMWAVVGMVIAAAFALVFAILVKLLWNWLMPVLFGLPLIGFWQAFGILLLAKILFGGQGHGGHRSEGSAMSGHSHRWFRRDAGAPGPLQREAWVGPSSRDDFNVFWEAEGREAFREFIARKEKEEPTDPGAGE
ncbi:MAG: hypothetical protein RB296_12450 [Acidobacteriota bacterium]|jgi:hypothetical protein|nr:hypothetical protein [Acidobacteriota bacterium]